MDPITLKLREPVTFGQSLIEELVIKPNARAFKDLTLPMTGDGKMDYQPYPLACIGVQMAGHPHSLVDKMSIPDMIAVSHVVMGFFL